MKSTASSFASPGFNPIKARTQEVYKQLNQDQEIQYHASLNLCRLSESIYYDQSISQNQKLFFSKTQKDGCSPWLPKKYFNQQPCSSESKIFLCKQKDNKNDEKQNATPTAKKIFGNKKKLSIFQKIKIVRGQKSSIKNQILQTNIVDLAKGSQLSSRTKINLSQKKIFQRIQNNNSTKEKNCRPRISKKKSPDCIKKISFYCIQRSINGSENKNHDKQINNDHWKSKSKGFRYKKPKKIEKGDIQDRKWRNIEPNSKSNSSEIRYESHVTNNPFTRLLYQKYVNTVSLNRSKDKDCFYV